MNKKVIFTIIALFLIIGGTLCYVYIMRLNCPDYVDCMPSINGESSCDIPFMCKGLTKSVY